MTQPIDFMGRGPPGYVVAPDPAPAKEPFKAMHELIEHNKDAPFGGAFVVAPPQGEEPLTGLLLTNDPAQFWMMVMTKVQARLNAVQAKESQHSGPFGRP